MLFLRECEEGLNDICVKIVELHLAPKEDQNS
jgi:hypothetical protein